METNFKSAMIATLALAMSFTGCSNDENVVGTNEVVESKSVSITIVEPKTYAQEGSAVGVSPTISDGKVYFIGNNLVLSVGAMTNAEVTAGKLFPDIPGAVSKVVFIGNTTLLSSPLLAPIVVGSSEAQLKAVMFEQSKQANPASAVNTYGEATITGTTTLTAAIAVAPAVSRIEIAQVSVNASALIPITGFKLTGIYINNTYTKLGFDRTTVPTAAADILKYGSSDPAWAGSYPTRFCDSMSPATAGTSFTPTIGTNRWAYYVMSTKSTVPGMVIDGVTRTSIPSIVLKIEGATATGVTLPNPAYVTIKSMKEGSTTLTELTAGKVYSIANIAIGGEHLASLPEVSTKTNIQVSVTITPWTNVPTTPDL